MTWCIWVWECVYVGQTVMCFQSTPTTGKKGLLHKFYTLNMCLYFTALFCFIYFYTSILLCKKQTKKNYKHCCLAKPCKSNFHIYTIQNDYIILWGFWKLWRHVCLQNPVMIPCIKVKKYMVVHGLKSVFVSLHSWKVMVFGNARFSSDSRVFSGEQGPTDILKA